MTTWIRVQKGSTSAKTHDPRGRSNACARLRSKNPTRAPGHAYPHARGCCMLTKSSFSRAKNSRSQAPTLVAAAKVIVVVRLPLRRDRSIERASGAKR